MPCSDSLVRFEKEEILQEKVNRLTRMLCGVCGKIADDKALIERLFDPELAAWWSHHRQQDKARGQEFPEKIVVEKVWQRFKKTYGAKD